MTAVGTYTISPAKHMTARWVVKLGPNFTSVPMRLEHLRVYVRAARQIAHARRA